MSGSTSAESMRYLDVDSMIALLADDVPEVAENAGAHAQAALMPGILQQAGI